jgi:large-conductance mechanosensitive channel
VLPRRDVTFERKASEKMVAWARKFLPHFRKVFTQRLLKGWAWLTALPREARNGNAVDKPLKIVPAAKHRLHWGQFVDKVFWFAISASAVYMSSQIREMSKSIEQLNVNMAVVLYQIGTGKERLDKQEIKIDKLQDQLLELKARRK